VGSTVSVPVLLAARKSARIRSRSNYINQLTIESFDL
jgi:hypothetical protein